MQDNDKVVDTMPHINALKKLKVVSLFSGCGGMDLGFKGGFKAFDSLYEQNPYEIIFANDIFDKACESYRYNFNHNAVCCDINNIDINLIPKADIVVGGFPCQDFSVAGKRKGLNAERGRLYLQMKKVVSHCNPIAFVAENVDGIRNSKSNSDDFALDIIIKDFENLGYNVVYKVLNASSFGVPQNRVRVIIVGIKKELNLTMKYPKETHGINSSKPLMTSKEAIDDLWNLIDSTNVFNHSSKDYSKAKFYVNKKLQGNNLIDANKPSPTIRAEHHGNIEGHYRTFDEKNRNDVSNWRRLSVRECARLQSFPDDFNFICSASSAYKLVGNAVPPILGWHIARALYLTLEKALVTV